MFKCRIQIHTSKLWVCHPTLLLDIVPPSPVINFWKFCRPMLLFQPMLLLGIREYLCITRGFLPIVRSCLPKPVSGISGADGRIKGITWEDFNIMIRIANKHYTNWKIDIRIVGRTPEPSRFIIFWEASILYWEANLPSYPALCMIYWEANLPSPPTLWFTGRQISQVLPLYDLRGGKPPAS